MSRVVDFDLTDLPRRTSPPPGVRRTADGSVDRRYGTRRRAEQRKTISAVTVMVVGYEGKFELPTQSFMAWEVLSARVENFNEKLLSVRSNFVALMRPSDELHHDHLEVLLSHAPFHDIVYTDSDRGRPSRWNFMVGKEFLGEVGGIHPGPNPWDDLWKRMLQVGARHTGIPRVTWSRGSSSHL